MSFFAELKRRNVFKVGIAYGIVSWLLIQIADILLPTFQAPDWVMRVFTLFMILGFPIAIFLAWVYELTPEGIKVTSSEGPAQFHTRTTGQRLNYFIIGVLLLIVAFLVVDNYVLIGEPEVNTVQQTEPATSTVEEKKAPAKTQTQQHVLPNSVAVLPFASLSLDPENAFFAAGIHDEILNQLAKISTLNVIARTSVLKYAETDKSISDIANELNVETIMEGTIRYGKDRLRLTAQLIDPETGTHLWSNTYDRKFDVTNVFEIETDIATSIASALEAKLTVDEKKNIAGQITESTEAWAYYLQATALIYTNLSPWESAETVSEFHKLLDKALEIDPDFATAHALKAVQYAFSMVSPPLKSDTRTPAHWERFAMESAERALEIDPENGLAYMAIALVHHNARRGTSALRAFENAIKYDPNNLDIIDDFARLNAHLGRKKEAVLQARRVYELDPNFPSTLAWMLFITGNLDEAAGIYYDALKVEPQISNNASALALLEAIRGNVSKAKENLQLAEKFEISNIWSRVWSQDMATRIYVYGRIGDTENAQRLFQKLNVSKFQYQIPDLDWALANLGIGDHAQALKYLRNVAKKSYFEAASTNFVMNIYQDPVLEQPEFVEVRNRLGFIE